MAKIELPEPLSAKFKEQFAYPTIKDRLPIILTKVVDVVYQYRNRALDLHGQIGRDDCKYIVSELSKLKNYMQTDKALVYLEDNRPDTETWNEVIRKEREEKGEGFPSWFKSAWLPVECYMYRKINEAIVLSQVMKDFDPFRDQKRQALKTSNGAQIILANYMDSVTRQNQGATFDKFAEFVQISLWGNKCDLSISAGVENSQKDNPIANLEQMKSKILVDNTEKVWKVLQVAKSNRDSVRVDIILDNAGFELFTDLCFMDFLLRTSLADVIHLHYKAMPWFVSDVTASDFNWTIQTLMKDTNPVLSQLGDLWSSYVKDGKWIVKDDWFWTTSHDFSKMKTVSPNLYKDLADSALCFFKGDLNYRKLVGDLNWPHTTPYEVTLQGFHPTPHCSLRASKCDVVVGLKEGQAEATEKENPDWMINGNYAVIEFCGKVEQ